MIKDKYIIIGCGGHAKSVVDIILDNDISSEIIFLDKNAKKDKYIFNFPVLKNYSISSEKVFVAIGDNNERVVLSQKYYNNLTNIISKRAYIGKNVQLGKGIFIGQDAHIGTLSNVSDFCLINTKAIVEHECILKKGVFIAPATVLCGKVLVGSNSFIGANSTVIEKISICDNVTVGANSTVINDINTPGYYIGTPTRILR